MRCPQKEVSRGKLICSTQNKQQLYALRAEKLDIRRYSIKHFGYEGTWGETWQNCQKTETTPIRKMILGRRFIGNTSFWKTSLLSPVTEEMSVCARCEHGNFKYKGNRLPFWCGYIKDEEKFITIQDGSHDICSLVLWAWTLENKQQVPCWRAVKRKVTVKNWAATSKYKMASVIHIVKPTIPIIWENSAF